MDKIIFNLDDGQEVEFFVVEQTKIGGINYLLATDVEEGDGEAYILKDLSSDEDEESVYEIVSDEMELDAVADMFESLVEDIEFISDDEMEL